MALRGGTWHCGGRGARGAATGDLLARVERLISHNSGTRLAMAARIGDSRPASPYVDTPERVNDLFGLELAGTAAVANGPEVFSNPENYDEKLQHYAVQRQEYEKEQGCHDDQHKDAGYLVQ